MANLPRKHSEVPVFYDTPCFLCRVIVLDGAWASGDCNGVLEVLAGLMRLIVQTALEKKQQIIQQQLQQCLYA